MEGLRDMAADRLAREPSWPDWVVDDRRVDEALSPVLTRPLSPEDLDVPWQLDFHHPRGVLPLGVELLDTMTTSSVQAAHRFGLGGGFTARLVGPFAYFGPVSTGRAMPVAPWWSEPAVITRLDEFAERFRPGWAADSRRLALALGRLEAVRVVDLAEAGADSVQDYLARAQAVHRDAWQVHFDTMYPLLGLLKRYLASCAELGVPARDAVRVLTGERTSVSEVDEGLRGLVELARSLGMTASSGDLLGPGTGEDPSSRIWQDAWDAFLTEHGHRGQGGADVATPSWLEDPGPLRELIVRALSGAPHRPAPPDDPDVVVARVGAGLTHAARSRFESLVRAIRRVNFAWWSEDHNVLIDLRAHLPVRTAGLAAGMLYHPEDPELALFLHRVELSAVLSGERAWDDLAELAGERRRFVRSWQDRHRGLPTTLGAVRPVDDLVLQEVFGAAAPTGERSAGVEGLGEVGSPGVVPASPGDRIPGLAVSSGTARGPARVITDIVELPRVRPGEVLVCEATSPAWTVVFDRIVGCVCNQGGMLTHAAIIAREFGVPALCAVESATTRIRDGDLVEVDAVEGEVRIWSESSGPVPPVRTVVSGGPGGLAG